MRLLIKSAGLTVHSCSSNICAKFSGIRPIMAACQDIWHRSTTAKVIQTFQSIKEPSCWLYNDETGVLDYRYRPKAGPSRNILVLDASFNPPTLAHAKLVEMSWKMNLNLDCTLLLLSIANADKKLSGAAFWQRMDMIRLMSEQFPPSHNTAFGLINRAKFVDKAKILSKLYGNKSQMHFVMGIDTLDRLFQQKYYENMSESLKEFFTTASVLVFDRSDCNTKEVLDRKEVQQFKNRIQFQPLPIEYMSISSTQVRKNLDLHKDISDLVCPQVANYARKYLLYTENKPKYTHIHRIDSHSKL